MNNVFDKEEYKYLLKYKPWKLLKRFFTDIKYCTQRIKKGYCDRDTWDLWSWFLSIIPSMLIQYKKERHGSPAYLEDTYPEIFNLEKIGNWEEQWDNILDEMIHYFREADENTCKKKNKYEEEETKACDEFIDKYGFFGEKLETETEKKERKKTGLYVWHTLGELPEYKDLENKYLKEERKLTKYRVKCKDKAFELFSKYFYDLWD